MAAAPGRRPGPLRHRLWERQRGRGPPRRGHARRTLQRFLLPVPGIAASTRPATSTSPTSPNGTTVCSNHARRRSSRPTPPTSLQSHRSRRRRPDRHGVRLPRQPLHLRLRRRGRVDVVGPGGARGLDLRPRGSTARRALASSTRRGTWPYVANHGLPGGFFPRRDQLVDEVTPGREVVSTFATGLDLPDGLAFGLQRQPLRRQRRPRHGERGRPRRRRHHLRHRPVEEPPGPRVRRGSGTSTSPTPAPPRCSCSRPRREGRRPSSTPPATSARRGSLLRSGPRGLRRSSSSASALRRACWPDTPDVGGRPARRDEDRPRRKVADEDLCRRADHDSLHSVGSTSGPSGRKTYLRPSAPADAITPASTPAAEVFV